MDLQISHHLRAKPGRKQTDDAIAHRQLPDCAVFAVADGMGSARAGGEAARRVVEQLVACLASRPSTWSHERALREAVAQLNDQLHQESGLRFDSAELVTTLCAVVLHGRTLTGIAIGDSSAWHWRDGRLRRLHELHRAPGSLNALTRAVGMDREITPEVFQCEINDGDRLLLCTDGVTGSFSPEELGRRMASEVSALELTREAQQVCAERSEPADDAAALLVGIRRCLDQSTAIASLDILPELRAGQCVAGHRLLKPIAPGGRVWLAEDDRAGARRVLKFPPLEARDDEKVRTLFGRELSCALRLANPEFFPPVHMPAGDVVFCYALDFIDAPTLEDCLRDHPLSSEEVVLLGRFLVAACQFLSSKGFVHGDIKPDNIIILRRGAAATFKLVDFGSAAPLFSISARAGTASYLAPERFSPHPHTERTEIFSIGVTLYRAATRTYPHGEIERFQTPRFSHARRPASINHGIPGWLDAVLLRATVARAADRYELYSELAYDLEHPSKVVPFHRPDAPLLERDPVGFWKGVALLLALLHLLRFWLAR